MDPATAGSDTYGHALARHDPPPFAASGRGAAGRGAPGAASAHQGPFPHVSAQYCHYRPRRSWKNHPRRPAVPPVGDLSRQQACRRTRDGDRKSVVKGKSVSVSVELGGGLLSKKKKKYKITKTDIYTRQTYIKRYNQKY